MAETIVGDLVARLRADTSEFAKGFKDAEGTAESFSQRMDKLGSAMSNAGRSMTLGLTLPIAAGAAFSVKAASDLEESQNKVQVVFGESADSINRWAKDSAQAFGLSKQAAFEAVGTFGNLFRAMDVATPTAAKMSKQLVVLAADLASFNNANPEEVLLALRSGLVGEAEPLRKFGVSLSAARIETEALKMGLAATKDELTAGAKAQAAYSIIMKDTALAQGDFARTSDGLANQMRTAKAEFEDAAASIGVILLPVFTKLVSVAAGAASAVSDLPGPLQTVVVVLGGLVAAAGPALWVIGSMLKNFGELQKAVPGLAAGLRSTASAALSLGAVFGGLAIVAGIISQTTGKVYDLDAAVRGLSRSSGQAQAALFAQAAAHIALERQQSRGEAMMTVFKATAEDNIGTAERLIASMKFAGMNTEAFERALRKEIAAQKQVAIDTTAAAAALDDQAEAADGAKQALEDLNDYIDAQTDAQLGLEGAAIRMDKSIADATETLKSHAATTLEGRSALLDAKTSVESWGKAVFDSARLAGTSTVDAKNQQIWALAEVAGSLAPGSPLRTWLEEYIGRLQAIPTNVRTNATIVAELVSANPMDPFGIYGTSPEGKAVGGPVMGGTPYMVGERGPELFVPGASGSIVPNHALGGGGSTTVNLILDGQIIEQVVIDGINRRATRGPGPLLASSVA